MRTGHDRSSSVVTTSVPRAVPTVVGSPGRLARRRGCRALLVVRRLVVVVRRFVVRALLPLLLVARELVPAVLRGVFFVAIGCSLIGRSACATVRSGVSPTCQRLRTQFSSRVAPASPDFSG
ncbi:hypothetical protein GCM10009826_16110 [Humibacillus xanthopallidus]